MSRATLCVMTLIAVLPSDVGAQAAPTRESSVDALGAGQHVRVRAADALSIEGVFLGLEGQDMLLSATPAEQAQRIPVDRLEALWVRTRATKKGAVIGAIAGGVLGIAAVIYVGPQADLSSISGRDHDKSDGMRNDSDRCSSVCRLGASCSDPRMLRRCP